jgi:hypothetical protein
MLCDYYIGINVHRRYLDIQLSNKAKAKYLLMSLPPFYANTVENMYAKEYKYDDRVHKLRDYVTAQQKSGKKKARLGDGMKNRRKSANTSGPKAGKG